MHFSSFDRRQVQSDTAMRNKNNFFQKIGGFMEILNKEFWEKRDAAMKRFMASKERKRKRMAELEQMLRQDYLARTGEEPKFVNVW